MAISTNDIKIRYVIDTSELTKAQQGFDKLSQEEQQAVSELKKLNKELDKTSSNASETGGGLMSAFKKGKDGIGGFIKGLGPVGPAIAGAFSVAAVVGFAKSVFEVTAQFQKLEAVLKNTLGSSSAAYAAMSDIQEFAKTTPFSVDELTSSFVKLANQGFRPSMDQMRKLGDLASSTGKSFDQLAEAIIDAQVGEFTRLKEFGVQASKSGDMITFSFKGVETQVRNNNEAIQQYLLSLGDYEGVAGASAAISETLGGKVNNLGDAWNNFLRSIGESLGPILQKALDTTAEFMDGINFLFNRGANVAKKYKDEEADYYKEITKERKFKNIETYSELQQKIKETEADLKKWRQVREETRKEGEEATAFNRAFPITMALAPGYEQKVRQFDASLSNIAAFKATIAGLKDEIKIRMEADAAEVRALQKGVADAEKKAQEKYDKMKKEGKFLSSKPGLDPELNKMIADEAKRKLAQIKEQYNAQLKLALLEKEQQTLILEIQGAGKEAGMAQEIIYQQKVAKIKEDYQKKGIGISKREVEIAELTAEKSVQEYEKAYQKLFLKPKDAIEKFQKDITKSEEEEEKKRYDNRLAQMKKWQKQYEQGLEDEKKAREKAEADKQAKIDATFQLTSTLLNGFSSMYQTSINNEIAALNKRYDTEIQLAGGNEQKIQELNNKRAEQERELRQKAFRADQLAAVAKVIFETAALIAKWSSNPVTIPLAAITLANQAAQIGFIMAQPVPEFAEGTKGKPFKGGRAMVGEKGVEKVVTASGKVYFTPPTATLVDLPSGSQVIPNHALSKQELFMASRMSGGSQASNPMYGKLDELGSILKSLPITQLNMDERGFEKYIRTERRTTKILNNRFRS